MTAVPDALALPPAVRQHGFANSQDLAAGLAAHLAGILDDALERRGKASLLVSGGRSPTACFEALREYDIDWAGVVIGLVDERWAPQGSSDRNDALVRQHLLRGRAAVAQLVPLVEAGLDMETELAAARRRMPLLPRPFDAVVLGMGTDGHTASWFPCAPECPEAMAPDTAAEVILVHPKTAPYPRFTTTLPVVFDTRQLLLQIEGAQKREVLVRAAQPGSSLPVAAVLRQTRAPLHVFVGA
ncbi:6-phosphogluconolactonase [Solimonas sp. K1W22B-7]|uniref:6-phosphogluconolactonase n=1 Tax=Solimonas sp. K1W22B-7 TaxID=2303331 RepID=UPI000E33661B|nr:6-phosphogluconolactonase [Solimonas sp. K1W22B-7]AXQ29399.1 6-phosphogluconolactonase [Solimonas sp. K1W22B-7]